MTLTLLDIYNETSEQAWSMYDSEATSDDDFESGLKSSIKKALNEIWLSYDFPFRIKQTTFKTKANVASYNLPDGNIRMKVIDGVEKYFVRYGSTFLEYLDGYELQEEATGEPEYFYVDNEKIYLYPTPDDAYQIKIDYITLSVGTDENNDSIYTLNNDTDTLDIPEKYEMLFKSALITLSIAYSIADTSDENYAQYMEQYNNAYKLLLDYCNGVKVNRRVVI